MSKGLKFFLPVVVIAGGLLAAAVIVRARPTVEKVEREVQPPLVQVLDVQPEDVVLNVRAQGTVEPATRSGLSAQVAGRVVYVAPELSEGSFIRKGATLLRLDSADYELAVTQSEARVAQSHLRLEREEAEAEMAIEEWREMGIGVETQPTTLVLREPQLAEARAEIKAATAALDQAKLHLSRTSIRAPFAGRVVRKQVDLGQYVVPGSQVAEVYSTDTAEIELKVPQSELRFIDISLGKPGQSPLGARLTARLGDAEAVWSAQIVRTGSEIDPQTRMVSLIAEVEDPFGLRTPDTKPMPMGLFLDAEIEGIVANGVIVLPRAALRNGREVLVVENGSELYTRPVEVLRTTTEDVILTSGVETGETVCVSPLAVVVDGMKVRTQAADAPLEPIQSSEGRS